jgi:hypothetical protein
MRRGQLIFFTIASMKQQYVDLLELKEYQKD